MDLEKLEAVAKAIKTLIAEQKRYESMRNKAGSATFENSTQRRMGKLSADMHFQAMHVRRCHKDAWRTIVDAELETTTDDEEASPSGWHKYNV